MEMLTLNIKSKERQELINITDDLINLVKESGIKDGICYVYNPHTTAGLTLNSRMDPNTATDLVEEIDRLVPTRVDFNHVFDTPSDASGHIKATLVGNSFSVIINDSKLSFGRSQGAFFWEFDGPRERRVHIKLIE